MDQEEEVPGVVQTILGILTGAREPPPKTMNKGVEKTIWEIYNERADIVNKELIRDWRESLNTLLIFAALYSAILTAFIIESMTMLQEDMQESTRDVLVIVSRQLANTSTPAFEPKDFTPENWALRVNYYFFTSISCSLVAALGAVLALQWVGSYDLGLFWSSAELQAGQRQLRYNGMEKWKLTQLISVLPLLLYISLFLFFVGLADWLWHIDRRIASIVVTGVVIAGLFYVFTHIIGIFDISAPFRTPISRSIPYVIRKAHSWAYQLIIWKNQDGPEFPDDASTSRRGMKYQLVKLYDVWLKLYSLIVKAKTSITTPRPAELFKQRERRVFESNMKIRRDSIVWVAKNIDDLPSSRPHYVALLKEAVLLPIEQLLDPYTDTAPWAAIFQNVFQKFYDMNQFSYEKLPDQEQAELESLLEATALIGTHGVLADEFDTLCGYVENSHIGSVSALARLAAWKAKGGDVDGVLDSQYSARWKEHDPSIITRSNSWLHMAIHRIYAHAVPNEEAALSTFLGQLASSDKYDGEQRPLALPLSVITTLMKIVVRRQGHDVYPGTIWEQYRHALSHIPESQPSDHTDDTLEYHPVILLQLLCHTQDSTSIRDEVLKSLLQAAETQASVFDAVRPVALNLLPDSVSKVEGQSAAQFLLGSVIAYPTQPSITPLPSWWDKVLTGCDRLLIGDNSDSRFTFGRLVSSLLRVADTTGYPIHNPNWKPTSPRFNHPAILILASLVLPNTYSLSPLTLKDMTKSLDTLDREDPDSWRKLLETWYNKYERTLVNRDIEAECIILLELVAKNGSDMISYLRRQPNQGPYWDILFTKHMQVLLSHSKAVHIFGNVQDTSEFPACFFNAGGITWITGLDTSQIRDGVTLVLNCIAQSRNTDDLRNSLELALVYIEITIHKKVFEPTYHVRIEQTLQNLLISSVPRSIGNRLLYSSFMDSFVKRGVTGDIRAEMEIVLLVADGLARPWPAAYADVEDLLTTLRNGDITGDDDLGGIHIENSP